VTISVQQTAADGFLQAYIHVWWKQCQSTANNMKYTGRKWGNNVVIFYQLLMDPIMLVKLQRAVKFTRQLFLIDVLV